jgi:DNA replication protein DnaC
MITSNTKYQQIIDNLTYLKLETMIEYLPHYLDSLNKKEISFTDTLVELTNKEINFRTERAARINLKISNFPYKKRVTDFIFPINQVLIDKSSMI